MSEVQEKRFASIGASLTITGPSRTVYDFRSDQTTVAKTTLDELWMEDLCIDRARDFPPQRARLKRVYIQNETDPATVEAPKESVFAHSHLAGPPDMSHDVVHISKTTEEIDEDIEAAQATEKLHLQRSVTLEFLSEGLYGKSIADILPIVEAYLLADFEEVDIPWKQRIGNVKAWVLGDPSARKTLVSKVDELIENHAEPVDPPEGLEGDDDSNPETAVIKEPPVLDDGEGDAEKIEPEDDSEE